MNNRIPPPQVQAAAEIVDRWLKGVEQPAVSPLGALPAPRRDLHSHFAARLDYCRQFDQSKMPKWQDPRGRR